MVHAGGDGLGVAPTNDSDGREIAQTMANLIRSRRLQSALTPSTCMRSSTSCLKPYC